VAGDDVRGLRGAPAGTGEKVEREPRLRILRSADQRQIEPQQPVDESMLRPFQLLPTPEIFGNAEVGNGPVQPTSATEHLGAAGRQQPVAGSVHGVRAESARPLGIGERAPAPAVLPFDGAQDGRLRHIAQIVSAALASGVLEVEQLAAVLTLEQLH
jgi:hypothetical protein